MKTVDVLIKAREYILQGWTKGRYCNGNKSCFCALGAIGMASPGFFPHTDNGNLNYPERSKAAKYLSNVIPAEYHGRVSHWNDAETRTVDDVLAAFDRAIKNAKRRTIWGTASRKSEAKRVSASA